MDWADSISFEPVWEIPTADGKGFTNRISIARAKELSLLPRVTGVVSDMLGAGYALQQYIKRTCILAAEQAVRGDGEGDEEYVQRISENASESARKSRDRGKDVHAGIARYLERGEEPEDAAAAVAALKVREFLEFVEAKDITCEKVIGSQRLGLVGTPDGYVGQGNLTKVLEWCGLDPYLLPIDSLGEIILDIKTTVLRKFKKPYVEWKLQFGGYANLLELGRESLYVSVVVDPWLGEIRWICHTDTGRWKMAYASLYEAWRNMNDYDPRF